MSNFVNGSVTEQRSAVHVIVQSVQDGTKIRVWRRSFVPKEFDANSKDAEKDEKKERKHTTVTHG